MSDVWISRTYFARASTCSFSAVSEVVSQLSHAGLTFHPAEQNGRGQWVSPDGMDVREAPDINSAIAFCVEARGGSISVGEEQGDMVGLLAYSPCGGGWLGPGEGAESEFGYASLYFDYTFFWHQSRQAIGHHYKLLFRWSVALARATRAIYGWGDFESQLGASGLAVSAADLKQRALPRFSWWNYFDRDYVLHVGRNRLSTAAAWFAAEDESGYMVIHARPDDQMYADKRDRAQLGF